jgi:hypothetical protein
MMTQGRRDRSSFWSPLQSRRSSQPHDILLSGYVEM